MLSWHSTIAYGPLTLTNSTYVKSYVTLNHDDFERGLPFREELSIKTVVWLKTLAELYSVDSCSAYNYTTVFRMRLGDSAKDSREPEITRTITFIDGQTHIGTVCLFREKMNDLRILLRELELLKECMIATSRVPSPVSVTLWFDLYL